MKGDLTNEHQALLSLCLNNAGVDAFERGHLGKAMMSFKLLSFPWRNHHMQLKARERYPR